MWKRKLLHALFHKPWYILALISFIACADRDRVNPLDPKNRSTQGRPSGVRVFSLSDTVFLSWQRINLSDLVGYQIYRKTNADSAFLPFKLNSPSNTTFTDTEVEFDTEYSYQISALGDDYESTRSNAVEILPGPTFSWAADNQTRQVIKLTHDARHRIHVTGRFTNIAQIIPNPTSGEAWIVDRFSLVNGSVFRISSDGKILPPILQFASPEDASLDESSGGLWINDFRDSTVTKLDSAGGALFTLSGFTSPISISVDQRTGNCWVADKGLQRIVVISPDGTESEVLEAEFKHLERLRVNSNERSVWVSDSTRVVKLNEAGEPILQLTENFASVSRLAVNEVTGELWILDFPRSRLLKFFANGAKAFEIDGLALPEDLAVNHFDGSCLVADRGNQRLVRISARGQVQSSFEGLNIPEAVAIQNPPR